MGLGPRDPSGTSINRGVGRPRVSILLAEPQLPCLPHPRLLQLADLAVRLATLPPCTCGYLGGVAPAALRRAADEPRRANNEPRHEGDLAARGRAAKELLNVDVINYVRLC